MNWDAIAAVAEIAGVLAVVVSVLYLAKQVRDANILSRTSTFREIMYGVTEQMNVTFGPENADLMIKGFKDFELLRPEEKLRFEHLMANLFQYAEDSWNSAQVGLLRSESVDNWSWYLRYRIFPHNGAQQWWKRMNSAYGSEFRKWVDSILSEAESGYDPYSIQD